jgi:hypothetical protein
MLLWSMENLRRLRNLRAHQFPKWRAGDSFVQTVSSGQKDRILFAKILVLNPHPDIGAKGAHR